MSKWKKYKYKYKAQIGLLFIVAVGALIFLGLIAVKFLAEKHLISVGKKTFYLSMEIDDVGTELVSLFNSKMNELKYIEIMGDLSVENYREYDENLDENLSATLERIKNKVGYGGYNFTIYNSTTISPSNLVKTYGTQTEEKKGISTGIALPGAQAGKCRGLARLEKW